MRNSVYLLTKCQSVNKTLTLCSNGHEKRSLTYEVRECQLSCTSTIEPPQNLGLPNREPSSKIIWAKPCVYDYWNENKVKRSNSSYSYATNDWNFTPRVQNPTSKRSAIFTAKNSSSDNIRNDKNRDEEKRRRGNSPSPREKKEMAVMLYE